VNPSEHRIKGSAIRIDRPLRSGTKLNTKLAAAQRIEKDRIAAWKRSSQ
jgi:hypothetical protein